MSRAGQADAVGGVFRAVAATYLAVHALREQPVAGLDVPNDVHATRLDFETDDPTDDLLATMSDGRRCFISAKRAIGNDRHLKSTVEGWVAQMTTVRGADVLVIAAEELKGPVKDLPEALLRRRDGRELAVRHQKAIAAVSNNVPAEFRDDLLNRVRVLHIPMATGTSLTRALLESMASYLVEDGKGRAVVSLLMDAFHRESGDASASTIETWVQTIQASRPLIADGSGLSGMRIAAGLAAIDEYKRVLTGRRGRIDLTLLAEDLPPVTVEDLIDGLRVETAENKRGDGETFLRIIRRWRRMLLVGQPGTGKSVALRELAAECAGDVLAPLPIVVHLPSLLQVSSGDLSTDVFLNSAAERVVSPELRPSLIRVMRHELESGSAILLCDGLDECGPRAAWIAQQIKDVLDSLAPRVGIVVATRANAVAAAARLELPRVVLNPPKDLNTTVQSVLRTCADARIHAGGRQRWLAVRRKWIEDAREQHPELFQVPLLAVLLALICADTAEAELPKGRAVLLHSAVEQSVTRWESQRALAGTRPWAADLTGGMLLDGYVVLGRLLDAGAEPSRDDAAEALATRLRDRDEWDLAPRRAREVAAEILRFWDEHVAVFVVNASDRLSARSKVFTEIATAMWTLSAKDDEIASWLAEVLPYTDSDGAIGLAAGLNQRVVECMLGASEIGGAASGLLGELAVREVIELSEDQTTRLLERVRQAVERTVAGEVDSDRTPREPSRLSSMLRGRRYQRHPAWKYVELACSLKLFSSGDRTTREHILATAELAGANAAIANALCALTDAKTDRQPLDERGIELVKAVMQQPLPPDGELVRESRRRSAVVGGAPLAPGVAQIALEAVPHRSALPDGLGRWAFDVSMKASRVYGDMIQAALNANGINTTAWWSERSPFEHLSAWRDDHDRYERMLLEDIASLARSDGDLDGPPERDRYWSLASLGDLLAATNYARVSVPEFSRAFVHDDLATRRGWLDAIAHAHGIDKTAAASEATWMLDQLSQRADGERGLDDHWFVASATPQRGPSLGDEAVATLTRQQHDALLDSLRADSDWIAWSAAEVLINVPVPTWDAAELFATDMTGWPLHRAALLYTVAIVSAGDRSIEQFKAAAASQAPDYRMAARYSVSLKGELDPDGSVDTQLRQDSDLTVRPSGSRNREPAASYWTCNDCRTRNELGTEDCPGCEQGTRPDRD